MNQSPELLAQVDKEGRLVFPAEVVIRFGLLPGAQVRFDEATNNLRLRRPATHLAKVYVEPTNRCNLECRSCIRNTWEEPLGQMTEATFVRIVKSLRVLAPRPTVFFGGFGEPLAHPRIAEMVAQVKALGAPVELITNGTLLTENLSRQLIEARLDVLWVSLDGATPESYTDVRLGAALPQVLDNITCFRNARRRPFHSTPEIGIVFVAMKRNVSDLPAVLRLGHRLDATRFMVSNVLPYTAAMDGERLYTRVLNDLTDLPPLWLPRLSLPRLDVTQITHEPLYQMMRGNWAVSVAGSDLGRVSNRCPFIESGVTAISWNGQVSPCLPLLHNHVSFLEERERFSRCYVIGNVADSDLSDLWNAPEYVTFRERVQKFDFSPCIHCGGCEFSGANEEDCFGNTFPTCGGCLWAQGVIQCP